MRSNIESFNHSLSQSGIDYLIDPKNADIDGDMVNTPPIGVQVLKTSLITHKSTRNVIEQANVDGLYDQATKSLLSDQGIDLATVSPTVKFSNEPEITFLGTISAKPGMHKLGSAIYVNMPGKFGDAKSGTCRYNQSYGIILDC